MANDGTIDITDLVAKITDTAIKVETKAALIGIAAIPYAGKFLLLPVIRIFTEAFVEKIITNLQNGITQQAFFLNTAIRKASQAHDYVDAKNALENMKDATDEQYQAAEEREMALFNNFVRVTN